MTFLQGNLALVLGVVGLLLALTSRRFSRDEQLRSDVGGAARWLGLFVVLRLNGFWVEAALPREWHSYLRVLWMLAAAFGAARLAVSAALWVRRRLTRAPSAKIHRDVADFILYVLVTIPLLKTQLHLDVTTLLGTSAVLSLVLGFALQDTLGNLFSGLSLQLESPYAVGDFIRVGEKEGRVVQVAWRSTRIETMRRELITIPNSSIAREHVTNFTRGGQAVAIDVDFGASYAAPPNLVRAEALEALREAPLVLAEPPPWVRVTGFGDSAVTYRMRFFIADFAAAPHAGDEVLSRLWYRFGRAGIEIPFPQRVVHLRQPEAPGESRAEELLARQPLFAPFPADERAALAASAVQRRFGAGEQVVIAGREGSTFYVVVSGRLSVLAGAPPREVAALGPGEAFGEMSLLTGEPRAATVVAREDCVLLELGREAFARHFTQRPERAAQLAALLEARRAGLAAAAAAPSDAAPHRAGSVAERLREIFGLRG